MGGEHQAGSKILNNPPLLKRLDTQDAGAYLLITAFDPAEIEVALDLHEHIADSR